MNENREFQKSLDIGDERIVPFVPFILQDLWALGGSPDFAVNLCARNGLMERNPSVIDLGCGKGATLVALAERFAGFFRGVDIMQAFIEEGRRIALTKKLKGTLELLAGDIAAQLTGAYDIVIFGYDTGILGTVTETLGRLVMIVKPGGHIVFETACRPPEFRIDDVPTHEELAAEIAAAGLAVKDEIVWDRDYVISMNSENNARIKKRCDELAAKHPKMARVFAEYVRNQREESRMLDEKLDCVSLLLHGG